MNQNIILFDMEEIFRADCNWDSFHGKTVLITGAYGMLASYLTYFFIYLHDYRHVDVRLVLLVRSAQKLERIIGKNKNFITCLVHNLSEPVKLKRKVDFIIHAASLASPQYYSTVPVDVLIPNTIGTYYLLELAREQQVEGVLLFSSSSIYGKLTDNDHIRENDYGVVNPLAEQGCYSESKRMAETMCIAYCRQYQVPVKIARIWHTYAPTMDIENDPRVFTSFVKNIIYGKDILLHSDGSGERAFCYITDAVSGFFKILMKGCAGEAYNVCNESQFLSVQKLAEILVALRPEKRLRVVHQQRSKNEHYTENLDMLGRKMCPSSKKLQGLGWKPSVDVNTGFDRVLKYWEV